MSPELSTTAPPRTTATGLGAMNRRSWYLIMNSLIGLWLIAVAVIVVIHRFVPAGGWLMIHLLLLGAVSSAVLIWSQHFADTLLRRGAWGGRAFHAVRLLAHTLGAGAVVAGIVTGFWPLVLAGGILVGVNAVAHAVSLIIQGRGGLPARFAPLVQYYIFACLALVAGVTVGVLLSKWSLLGELRNQFLVAHMGANLLGWVGLTVIGTVILLWPTVLRTRVSETTDASARGALILLVTGTTVFVTGALVGVTVIVAIGLVCYLAGFALVFIEGVRSWRAAPPTTYAGWTIASAVSWLAVCTIALGVIVITAADWSAAVDGLGWLVAPFAVGFGAQIVFGALSYLLPVVLGGGPFAARASAAVLNRGAMFRVISINGGIVLYLLPVPSLVKVIISTYVFVVLLSFLVLVGMSIRAGVKAKGGPTVPADAEKMKKDKTPAVPIRHTGAVVLAISALVLSTTIGVALDPAAAGLTVGPSDASSSATGNTTTVEISMKGMRFFPDVVNVPAGDRLVIELTNADDQVHDLVIENGTNSGRISAGETVTVDAGVIAASLDGWCSIAGHRLMGMVMQVVVTGGDSPEAAPPVGHEHGTSDGPSAALDLDFMATPGAGFTAREAALEPASSDTVHDLTLRAVEVKREVAVGVTQELWTFNGTAPGPTIRGKVGDTFNITLVNDGTFGHSIDFHASALAPDQPMRTIGPGESLSFSFTAHRSGIWLYHCSTMPMSVHIANGMFGAVIIDPPDLPEVDREYVMVQSELYLGAQDEPGDVAKMVAQTADAVVFNGFANQYQFDPLPATVGERVRVWVLDAGPNLPSSFHIVGGQFDTVFLEGDYRLKDGGSTGTGGSQALGLFAAQGGFVELEFPEAGHYPFVTHLMSDAERGATGIFRVTE